jgi:hypothetical protein
MRNRLNEGIGRIHKIMYKDIISEQNIPKVDFSTLAITIINKLEGGYYHPDMLRDGRIKDSRYGASGETLFGIDRIHGKVFNVTPDGRKFWNIIDQSGARTRWPWLYMGGEYENELKKIAINMIKVVYVEFLNRHVKDKNIIDFINSNAGLCINFIYAVWNGERYFREMAEIVVRDYNNNIKDTNVMVSNLIKYRKNHTSSLIRQGGEKIEKIINDSNYATVTSGGLEPYDVEADVKNTGDKFLNTLYNKALQGISSPAGNKQ